MATEYRQYTFKLYVSTVTQWGQWDWSDFQDTGKTLNIGIPIVDSADFYDWFKLNIEGNKLQNYVTGIYTDEFYDLNYIIPAAYFRSPGLKYASQPISASKAAYSTFPALYDVTNLLSSYISNYSDYLFAISSDDNSYYLVYKIADTGGGYLDFCLAYDWLFPKTGAPTETVSIITWAQYYQWEEAQHDINVRLVVKYANNYMYFGVSSPYYEGTYLWCWGNSANKLDETQSAYLTAFLESTPSIVIDPLDPYNPEPQPEPTPEIPTGEFDFESDPVPVPSLPTISAVDTGFTRLFNPSLSQLNSLASYMWTDATFWDTLKNKFIQMVEDPMKYIISLNLVPVAVPNGAAIPVKLLFITTPVSMPPVTNQFVRVDCGTYTVKRNYGSALDFAPNTKVSIYLPYIGTVPLDVDEIMPSPPNDSTTLGVEYTVDVFSGTCVAMVTVNGDVKYQFSGHCAIGIPFSAADFSVYQGALIQAAKTVLGAGAIGAGLDTFGSALLGAPVQKTSETVETVTRFNPETNRKLSPWEDKKSSVTKAQFGSLVANNITSTVSQVAASKPSIERSAGFSGNSGYLAVRRPYLLFESPRLVNPQEYGNYNGYPSMMYLPFEHLSGFTQVQQIQLTGFSGTNPEIDELLGLLKSGVIF